MVEIIAHRGNSSEAPENTLAAFRQAIELNVDRIECDLRLTADNVPVTMHDPVVQDIAVATATLDELKTIDVGASFSSAFQGEQIATFEELLLLPRGKIGLMVELKSRDVNHERLVDSVVKLLDKHQEKEAGQGAICVGSFDPALLECFHRAAPRYPLIAIAENEGYLNAFKQLPCSVFALSHKIATPSAVKQINDSGYSVWVWTVNDPLLARYFIALGIHAIITDKPKVVSCG
ncbi:hypothetical protein JYU14_03825 [Simkania negevensis]|uniref:GP-PDE domain-containing protein n=1 Tax=Simkania negevensis TaxID=83561 RepID=A0ABS3ASM2_9BACT|nr:hypothetical protein [Simkania negevensis]